MKVKIETELKPFTVPNYVIKKGDHDSSYHLSELSAEDLEIMCDEFKQAVFEKAGKSRPRTVNQG